MTEVKNFDEFFIHLEEVLNDRRKLCLFMSPGTKKRMSGSPNFEKLLKIASEISILSSDPSSIFNIRNSLTDIQISENSTLVAIGGGSVIDAVKILKYFNSVSNRKDTFSGLHLQLPENKKLVKDITLYCIPTTAGSGSEATHFATIWDRDQNKKYSLADAGLEPELVCFDNTYFKDISEEQLIIPALDALTQCLESLWNKNATLASIQYAKSGLTLSLDAFDQFMAHGKTEGCVDKYQLASYFSGAAINITKTSICHAMSYPISSQFLVPHGLAVFIFVSPVLQLLKENDIFLHRLSDTIQFEDLHEGIGKILKNFNFNEIINKFICPDNIRLLDNELFFHPGRSDTFLLDVDDFLIDRIKKLL